MNNTTYLVIDNNNIILATFDDEDDALSYAVQKTPVNEVCYKVIEAIGTVVML